VVRCAPTGDLVCSPWLVVEVASECCRWSFLGGFRTGNRDAPGACRAWTTGPERRGEAARGEIERVLSALWGSSNAAGGDGSRALAMWSAMPDRLLAPSARHPRPRGALLRDLHERVDKPARAALMFRSPATTPLS
jgi:hypothetical protein